MKSKVSLDYSANTGLLYKAPKPNQDIRFDVPVVGETTLRKVKEANLRGIALRKNCVILLEKQKIIQLADEFLDSKPLVVGRGSLNIPSF